MSVIKEVGTVPAGSPRVRLPTPLHVRAQAQALVTRERRSGSRLSFFDVCGRTYEHAVPARQAPKSGIGLSFDDNGRVCVYAGAYVCSLSSQRSPPSLHLVCDIVRYILSALGSGFAARRCDIARFRLCHILSTSFVCKNAVKKRRHPLGVASLRKGCSVGSPAAEQLLDEAHAAAGS